MEQVEIIDISVTNPSSYFLDTIKMKISFKVHKALKQGRSALNRTGVENNLCGVGGELRARPDPGTLLYELRDQRYMLLIQAPAPLKWKSPRQTPRKYPL
jgi:hypothetical protein